MSKKLISLATISVLSLLIANSSAASPATEQSIRELLSATGAGKMGVQVIQSMLPALKQTVPQVPESFWTDFMKEVNPDEMIGLIVPIYKKHFTEEEIQETIKFYKSPTGKKIIQKQPQVMQESMAVGQQWGQQLAQRVIEKAKNLPAKSP